MTHSQESRFDTSKHGVKHNSYWQEEAGCSSRDSRQVTCDGGTTTEKHSSHQDIRLRRGQHMILAQTRWRPGTALCLESGRLTIRPNVKKTACVATPYRALMTSRNVWALGARLLSSIAIVANNRICTVAPEAYQNGPLTSQVSECE